MVIVCNHPERPVEARGLCQNCYGRWRYWNNPAYRATRKIQMKGSRLSAEEFDMLLDSQNGCCAICGRVNSNGFALSIDHDHVTGRVRGLLCASCNRGLGLLGDNVESVQRAVDYLMR